MIGWNKAKSPKQPHVPLKQLEKQLVGLSKIIEKRAPNAKKPDDWWRDRNKVPYRVLAKRAGRLASIIKDRSKNRKAWNGSSW